MAKDRILAIDIGSSSLKIAEFRGQKGKDLELVKFGVGSLGSEGSSENENRAAYLETTIQEVLHENGIKPGPALISVAGQSVFSRFVKLPPVEADKVFQIIQYEAQQNVPFPIDEVVWDYQLVGGATQGEIDVMLAAIKAEIIEEITSSVRRAGLETMLVDVAPMTLFNIVRYNYPQMEGTTLIVDIGARSTDLIFMEGTRVFIRSVPVAGNAITQQIMKEFDLGFSDAEEMKKAHAFVSFGAGHETPGDDVANRVSHCVRSVMTRMHAEINRSINFYRSQQSGSAPSLILLTGGSSVIHYTDVFLKEKLKVEVQYLNPFQNVSVSSGIPEDHIGRHIHQLSEVAGLALRMTRTCPIEINLLPGKIIEEREFNKKQPVLIGAMVALVLALAVWCGYFLRVSAIASANLEQVSEKVDSLRSVEKRIGMVEELFNGLQARTDEILGLSERRSYWPKLLDSIHSSVLDGMWLTQVRPLVPAPEPAAAPVQAASGRRGQQAQAPVEKPVETGIRKIEISGKGYIDKVKDGTDVISFRDNLRKSPYFAEETEIQQNPAPGPDDFVRAFKVIALLEDGAQQASQSPQQPADAARARR